MTDQMEARLQFATWVKKRHPALFQRAVKIAEDHETGLAALGEEKKESFWSKFTTAVTGLGTTYLTLRNQKEAMELNLQRARQGMPPIDVGATAPVVRTQVDVSPELAQRLVSTAGEGINKTLLVGGGLALLAIVMFARKR